MPETLTAQTVAPGTEPSGWMPLTDEIRQSAPDNIKKLLEVKGWKTGEDIAKGYSELEKFTGVGKHLVIPESDDTEGWNNIWNQLGRPETPDKYQFEPDERIDENTLSLFKQFAHKKNFTQDQAKSAVEFQLDILDALQEVEEQAKQSGIQALKEAWKDKYQQRHDAAVNTANTLGISQMLQAKGLMDDPVIIEMLDTLKSRTSESVLKPSTPPVPTKDPREELEEIMKSEAFKQRFHPKHKEIMARYMELNNIIANSGMAPKRPQGG